MLRSPTKRDAEAFLERMSNRKGSVVTEHESLERYNVDWTKQFIGKSKILLKPQTSEEISSILKYCNEEKIGVVPQAGNTGLVGGSVPVHDEVIVSIEKLNEVYDFDEVNGILSCESGCILQFLQEKVASSNHLLPLDFGAKGICMIGGNISTNAGGVYYYRFGSIHANVLGLEVILPDGTILDLMNKNRKDNTGYDLKHLFIGAEGTLGIVSKVIINCPRLPTARHVTFLACESFDAVQKTLDLAKAELGEILAAFEFMDQAILDEVGKEKKIPIAKVDEKSGEACNYRFCLTVETLGSNNEHDLSKMESFIEKSLANGYVVDGVLAQDLNQLHEIWDIRLSCNPIIKSAGYNYKYDISLPIEEYYSIVEEMRERLTSRPDARDMNWGHVIDGNLHFNVITPGNFDEDPELKALLDPYLYEAVAKRGGSISAEHGLGRSKKKYLGTLAKNPAALDIMRTFKSIFDPHGIMNPGKYLPMD